MHLKEIPKICIKSEKLFFSPRILRSIRAKSDCEKKENEKKNDNKFKSIRGCLWPKRIVMITNDVDFVREPKHFICHLNVNRKESIDKLYSVHTTIYAAFEAQVFECIFFCLSARLKNLSFSLSLSGSFALIFE